MKITVHEDLKKSRPYCAINDDQKQIKLYKHEFLLRNLHRYLQILHSNDSTFYLQHLLTVEKCGKVNSCFTSRIVMFHLSEYSTCVDLITSYVMNVCFAPSVFIRCQVQYFRYLYEKISVCIFGSEVPVATK